MTSMTTPLLIVVFWTPLLPTPRHHTSLHTQLSRCYRDNEAALLVLGREGEKQSLATQPAYTDETPPRSSPTSFQPNSSPSASPTSTTSPPASSSSSSPNPSAVNSSSSTPVSARTCPLSRAPPPPRRRLSSPACASSSALVGLLRSAKLGLIASLRSRSPTGSTGCFWSFTRAGISCLRMGNSRFWDC